MKVLLISQPDTYPQKPDFPPIGLAILGAVARAGGHEVLLIDAALSTITEIAERSRRFGPDVVGVSCWTIGRAMVWALCEALKREIPRAFLVVGGPHATLFPGHIFKKTHASAVVIGEGEETFKELLGAVQSGRDLSAVSGLALRGRDGGVSLSPKRAPIVDMDAIPFPLYDGFEGFKFSNYWGEAPLPRPTASVISSRGCVFDCTYCGSTEFWGRKWRYRSAANILDELYWLITKMGVKSVYFYDDNFPVNKKRLIDICEGMLSRGINIKWSCCSHVKMLDKGSLEAMKKSGCVKINFGVESGSEKILKSINKQQTAADIEKAFALVHEAGITPRAYLMVGNPGETEETIDQTIELVGKINPGSSIGATLLWLLPGTAVYRDAVKKGYIDDNFWLTSDLVPYNLQEHSYEELMNLRGRLMLGVARKKGGLLPIISYHLKNIYYRYPKLALFRSLVPDRLR